MRRSSRCSTAIEARASCRRRSSPSRIAAIAPLEAEAARRARRALPRARVVLRAAARRDPCGRRARRRDDPGRLLRAERLSRWRRRASTSGRATRGRSASATPRRSARRSGVGDRVVVSVSGDGGFLYNVGELATAAQHDIGARRGRLPRRRLRQRAADAAGEHRSRDRVAAAEPRSREARRELRRRRPSCDRARRSAGHAREARSRRVVPR